MDDKIANNTNYSVYKPQPAQYRNSDQTKSKNWCK